MSGAISAGAYTAGVLDFLIEALDAWEDARNGPDADTVPNHRVGIKVMSGASAGAITAAISAIALVQAEDAAGKRKAPGAYVKDNFTYRYYLPKLYEAWVVKPSFVAETKGATDFLSLSDVDSSPSVVGDFSSTSGVPESQKPKQGTVISVLNTRLLDEIAASAVAVDHVMRPPRAYLSKTLHIYMTLSNLRGVPYEVKFFGGGYHMISHGDRVHYSIEGVGTWESTSAFADNDRQRSLSASGLVGADGGEITAWKDYAICALASSAFPIGLSPRQIHTTVGPSGADEYGKRLFPDPVLINRQAITPNWSAAIVKQGRYLFTGADGGIIDNDPFEYAHFSLKDAERLEAPIPSSVDEVDRAVIMVSPFPEEKPIPAEGRPGLNIVALATALLPALIDQARFKPDQLALALDEKHASRYLIGPRRDGQRYRIASGLLGGFGGFVSRSFRDFDFQLGRRNCQRFLQTSFVVGSGNEIVRGWGPKVDREKFRALPDRSNDPAEEPGFCLIPLYGTAVQTVALPGKWPQISQKDFDELQMRIAARFDRVAPLLLEQNVGGLLGSLLRIALLPVVNSVFSLFRDKVLKFVKLTILSDLVRRDQIDSWNLPTLPELSPDDLHLVVAELVNPRFELRTVAGIYQTIRTVTSASLTPQAIEGAISQLKCANGKPYQVWEAGWQEKTEGADASLYTLASRRPWWTHDLRGGGFVARLFQPTVDGPVTVGS